MHVCFVYNQEGTLALSFKFQRNIRTHEVPSRDPQLSMGNLETPSVASGILPPSPRQGFEPTEARVDICSCPEEVTRPQRLLLETLSHAKVAPRILLLFWPSCRIAGDLLCIDRREYDPALPQREVPTEICDPRRGRASSPRSRE